MLNVVEPNASSFVPLKADMLYTPEFMVEPIFMVALLAVTFDTGNWNTLLVSLFDANFIMSPEANPFAVIVTLEFKVTEIVQGIETPVNLNEVSGVPPPLSGLSFEHPEKRSNPTENSSVTKILFSIFFIFSCVKLLNGTCSLLFLPCCS